MHERPGVKLIERVQVALRLVEERDLDELYRPKCKSSKEDVFVPRDPSTLRFACAADSNGTGSVPIGKRGFF